MSSSNKIFNLPQTGKPDPFQKYEESGQDCRARVIQKKMTEFGRCSYYTLNYLRERIGKHPDNATLPARIFEAKCSKLRKNLDKITKCIPNEIKISNEAYLIRMYGMITKSSSKISKEGWEKLKEVDPCYANSFESFQKQNKYSDLFEYIHYLKYQKTMQLLEQFLTSLKIDIKAKYKELHMESYQMPWDKLPLDTKFALLHNYVFLASAEGYNLQISSWNPHNPIETLMKELEISPLYIGGRFGQSVYKCPPTEHKTMKVQGRSVYYWKKTDPKTEPNVFHAILLVGADKDSNMVFYIDCNDKSDPKNPEKQPVYMMSYDKIKREIMSLNCDRAVDWSQQILVTAQSQAGFAYRKKPDLGKALS